ncbi:hypothetical protein ACFE04_030938 [Oxalis oulophora]
MTTSFLLLSAVILFLFKPTTVTSLGSGSTLAVAYGDPATVCGIVSGETTQNIICQQHDRNYTIHITPKISFSAVAGGDTFFCGLRSGGYTLLCWETTGNYQFVPRRIYHNTTLLLTNITIGDSHVCATTVDLGVKCWRGVNNSFTMVPRGFPSLVSLTSGYGFTCGIVETTKMVMCRGTNTKVVNLITKGFVNVTMLSISAGGAHVCGINTDGVLICKGDNSFGQLNVPLGTFPFEFSGGDLALGGAHSCAIRRSNGSVVCWGSGFLSSSVITAGFQFELIVAASNFTCGLLRSNFSVVCWGLGWFSNGGGYGSSSKLLLDLPSILPGPCVQSSCSECGVYPESQQLCSGSGNVCRQCDLLPNITVMAAPPYNRTTVISSPARQGSWVMRRQRSGTSSMKHTDRAEEFTFSELATATNDFSLENKIGAGSFGVVYKGKLSDGREVAIKRGETAQKAKKFQEKESAFDSELAFLSRLHHKHLVRLVGFCEEKDERLLVYDYMKNGALYDHLHNKDNVEKNSSVINSWKLRIKIALDAARGIEYLHNYAVPPIIHRDIKSSNILLDLNWTARVSDFGLSLLGPESDRNYRPMKAAGTVGYIDPEYYGLNILTAKSDIYGLGVVLLELLTGKRAIFKSGESGGTPVSVVDFAVPVIMAGELAKILDSRVGPTPELSEGEAIELVAYTAINCVHLEGKERPNISDIVANLERALALCEHSHGSISSSGLNSIVSE